VPRLRRSLAVVLIATLAFLAPTLVALEGQEVVQIRTTTPDGTPRVTRAWIADEGGAAWLEAATPERGWYQDLQRDPRFELVRDGVARPVLAAPEPGAAGHAHVRRLLHEKYGWADTWVGWLQDTSRSIAVKVTPR